jgi:hypothetical protein
MREAVLRDFFEGRLSAASLTRDLYGALVTENSRVTRHRIVDMAEEFEVRPAHLIMLCNAVLDGTVPIEQLKAIGFCLVASDAFHWDTNCPDGERVAEVAHDWSTPEINYPLTLANVAAWRGLLLGEPAQFETRSSVVGRDR